MTMATRHTATRLLSLALVASLAGLLLSASAAAQDDPAHAAGRRCVRHPLLGSHARHAVRREAIARKLGLTDEQRDQMRATAKQTRPTMEQSRQSLRAAADTLRSALAAQPRDAATVAAAHVAMDQARDNAKAARETRRAELGAALTPEQRAQFEAARQARKDGKR
jgi:Spy/CpxP family protein refolding chaperone